ncbi:MAG: hypothetical protein VX583_08375 [Bdellovibrionota bacterium]|nr:hypothetical protein [Pseudobdellovibrionaceae bacterium]|tara:strand:- start:24404 stop:24952 length:549 start_codon:yes stop_codon:yes gene_type:complete
MFSYNRLKRYTFQLEAKNLSDIEKTKRDLKELGLSDEDIDYVYMPSSHRKGFYLEKKSSSMKAAGVGAVFGLIWGLLAMFFWEFDIQFKFENFMLMGWLANLIFLPLGAMTITALLGLIMGNSSHYYEIRYGTNDSKSQSHVLFAVNVSPENKHKVENMLKQNLPRSYFLNDHKFESEIGIR